MRRRLVCAAWKRRRFRTPPLYVEIRRRVHVKEDVRIGSDDLIRQGRWQRRGRTRDRVPHWQSKIEKNVATPTSAAKLWALLRFCFDG